MAGEVGQTHLPVDKRNSDFLIEVAKGNIPGHSIIHKFGHGIVAQVLSPLSNSLVYQTPMAPVSLEFVSDSADDTALGTGAREITFIGIDATYGETTFTIETAGLVPVALPTDLLRLHTWFVSKSGIYATSLTGSHGGELKVRVAGVGATWDLIEATPFPTGRSEIGAYTVPDGFRAMIVQHDIHVDSAKAAELYLFERGGIDIVTAPFEPMRIVQHYVGLKGENNDDFKAPLDSFSARTDLGYMGSVLQQTADITVYFAILLIQDGY